MQCTIINGTPCGVKLRECFSGFDGTIGIIAPGGKYILKHDPNATYREYEISDGLGVKEALRLTSDDLLEWSEVTLWEGPDGALKWLPLYRGFSDKTYEPARKSAKCVSLKFDTALRSYEDLERLRKRVKICVHQCDHLLQTYEKGIQKMAQFYSSLIGSKAMIVQRYRDDRLTELENTLDSLEYIVCDAKELLGSCAKELGKVALVVSIPRPPVEKDIEVYSDFDLLIRELEWHFDVMEYLIELPWGAKFDWSPTMCRYVLKRLVLAQEKAPDEEVAPNQERPRDLDRKALQTGLDNGSISIPNTIQDWCRWKLFGGSKKNLNDTILKRCKAQDLQSCPMEIDHLDLHGYRELGKGTFKKVFKGKWYGQSVAIATIRMDDLGDPDTFKNEVNGLLQVQHPKVVSLFGWAETTDAPAPIKKPDDDDRVNGGYIVTEKMECSLDDLIKDRRRDRSRNDSGPFSHSVGIDILLQIVEAMLHVQNCGVMHRDLKPGNVLVNRRSSPARRGADTFYNVKLIDFGNSKPYSGEDENTYNKGTTMYAAPEMQKGRDREADHGKYDRSVDVFSFAMTCYQVVTGKKPFQSMRTKEGKSINVAEAIQNKLRPEFGVTALQGLRELTEECWKHDPKERPSFKEIQERLWTIKMKLAVREFYH